jgi:hypothetical protein
MNSKPEIALKLINRVIFLLLGSLLTISTFISEFVLMWISIGFFLFRSKDIVVRLFYFYFALLLNFQQNTVVLLVTLFELVYLFISKLELVC